MAEPLVAVGHWRREETLGGRIGMEDDGYKFRQVRWWPVKWQGLTSLGLNREVVTMAVVETVHHRGRQCCSWQANQLPSCQELLMLR